MVLKDFQESREAEEVIFSWPVIFIAAVLALAALWGGIWALGKTLALRRDIKGLEKDIEAVESSKKMFEERLEYLRTEAGLDHEARDRFNLKKSGEEAVVFLGEPPAEQGGGAFKNWLLNKLCFFRKGICF